MDYSLVAVTRISAPNGEPISEVVVSTRKLRASETRRTAVPTAGFGERPTGQRRDIERSVLNPPVSRLIVGRGVETWAKKVLPEIVT
jgi:hypothetical protein